MEGLGKILLIVGGIIIVIGLLLIFGQHIPFFGKMPGDIVIKKDNFTFYFPVVTFIILSIVITVIINIIIRFIGK
jgi:uncharacterized protein HemY